MTPSEKKEAIGLMAIALRIAYAISKPGVMDPDATACAEAAKFIAELASRGILPEKL
jgi:hypothetical protein